MPKSDTWPGGIGMEPMTGMDSAGSCDSVLSTNSGFSDDSLEHLTAEEKACIMFLEETIESLDTEEDSGLSNDEPDQLPSPGNLANKLADLSASMSRSLQKAASQEPVKQHVNSKPMQSYLVPTPFVVASSAPCSAKPGVPPDNSLGSKPRVTPSSNKRDHKYNPNPGAPQVPLEVNVVIPPPTKPPRDHSCRVAEDLPRGPLSYEALFHLRRSASTKKTPLCPTIDHTIDLDRHLPIREEGPNIGNHLRSDRFHSEAFKSKAGPPVVAPKPTRIPGNICVKPQNETSTASDSSYNIKNAKDPKVVRLEALQKLGLLKDQPSHSSVNPTANRFTSDVHPSRSTSFYHSQVPAEPKNRPLQSSASFHHYARCDSQPALVPAQTNAAKAGGLERSATMDSHRNGGNCQAEARVPSNSVGYTVMVVPGMGADRREALRKLGLLKD